MLVQETAEGVAKLLVLGRKQGAGNHLEWPKKKDGLH
jgi:hypothetical protein